jgi:hypothetical protein
VPVIVDEPRDERSCVLTLAIRGEEKSPRHGHDNHLDPTALKTQMGYLTDGLRNTFQSVGAAISAAKTEEEATKAFKPYVDRLAAQYPLPTPPPGII